MDLNTNYQDSLLLQKVKQFNVLTYMFIGYDNNCFYRNYILKSTTSLLAVSAQYLDSHSVSDKETHANCVLNLIQEIKAAFQMMQELNKVPVGAIGVLSNRLNDVCQQFDFKSE
jgi:hypothetical protein